MRRTKREIMDGIDSIKSFVVANNTVEYTRENGDRVIRLHLTDIVTFKPDGGIVLTSGGWQTVTTKERMNRYIGPWQIWSDKGVWYLSRGYSCDREVYTYHEGIVITGNECDGKPYNKEEVKRQAAQRRKVRTYARNYMKAFKAGKVPAPGLGDCFGCSMVDKNGQTSFGGDHILEHVKEKYYVPSLLLRAISEFPVSQVAKWCLGWRWQGGDKPGFGLDIGCDQLEKSLFRYCVRHGLGQSA